MAGPTTRKNKAHDDASSPSLTKRVRTTASERSSSTMSSSDRLNGTDEKHDIIDNAPTLDTIDLPDYVTDDVRPRIEKLRVFSEPAYNRFCLTAIPADADWGRGVNGRWSHLEGLLCYKDKPVVAWMVGVARWVNLEDPEKFTIGLRLLCDEDREAAIRNSLGRCVPPQAPKEEGTLTYANKWVEKKARGSSQIFTEAYGAVDRELQGWDVEQKVPATTISPSDVVVVEFYIRRFKGKAGNSGRKWTTWGVNFDLLRIAQVFVGPGPIQEAPPDSSARI